jgi:putative ABC transport system permease protein
VERPGIGPYRPGFTSSIDVFRNEVKKNPGIESVSLSANIPGMQREFSIMVKTFGSTDDKLVPVKINAMDYEFLDVFKMNLIAGRPFMESHTQDPDTSIIITESTARLLGFEKNEEAVGQTLSIPSFEWSPIIVGIVNDYHQVSLKEPLKPTFFVCNKYDGEYFAIRIHTSDLEGTIEHVRSAWKKTFPGNPFEYFFLDDYFNQQYKNERQFGAFFSTFAALALFIGCLGLLGLSAYAASQRTKEIGIRKVLGSTEGGIFFLLSKEYIKLIMLAIFISVPLVYFVMNSWIESFTYRISISEVVFLIAGGAVFLLSLSTVSFQTWRAARANPADSIRHD